jgi:DNA-binding transcriptional LysR family regulator
MDINFELYKIFYHAASTGSFSEAARRLFITQSAVSQAIGGLEEKTGNTLFMRSTRNVRLTDEGRMLFSHIEQAYNLIRAAEGKLQEMKSLDLGEIRIGVGDTVCRYLLLPCLERFIAAYPKIKLRVINRTSPQIVEILKKGRIDLGVVTLPVADEAVDIEDFRDAGDIFVASSRFAALGHRTVPLSELVTHPLLLLQKDSSTRRNLDAFFEGMGFTVTPEIELESIELLVEFARIGLGVAHVMRESAGPLIKSGELFEIRTAEPLPPRRLGIATVKKLPLSSAATRFIELLRQ